MRKSNKDTDILSDKNKRKWFGHVKTYYGKASIGASVVSGLCAFGAPFFPGYWSYGLGAVAAISAGVAWTLNNADRYKNDTRSKIDFDGLVRAIDKSHSGLSDAASVSPDDKYARKYIETVLDELRILLEPDGEDNCVRICLYRKDSEERKEKSDGDPRIEQGFSSDKANEVTVSFTRYVFQRGGRTDTPRWSFDSATEPGSAFFSELFSRGRYDCNSKAEHKDIGNDKYYEGKVTEPAYGSFVNIALKDDGNETFAMLTCDSVEEHFFDERRNRLIKAFIPLIKLALQDGATNVPEPKSRLDQLGLVAKQRAVGPIKPNRRVTRVEKLGDDDDA